MRRRCGAPGAVGPRWPGRRSSACPPRACASPIDPFDLADQGKRIVGCNYGSSVPAVDFPRLARLYLAGRLPLEKLVGRRRRLDEAAAALDDLRDAVGLRTVLVP